MLSFKFKKNNKKEFRFFDNGNICVTDENSLKNININNIKHSDSFNYRIFRSSLKSASNYKNSLFILYETFKNFFLKKTIIILAIFFSFWILSDLYTTFFIIPDTDEISINISTDEQKKSMDSYDNEEKFNSNNPSNTQPNYNIDYCLDTLIDIDETLVKSLNNEQANIIDYTNNKTNYLSCLNKEKALYTQYSSQLENLYSLENIYKKFNLVDLYTVLEQRLENASTLSNKMIDDLNTTQTNVKLNSDLNSFIDNEISLKNKQNEFLIKSLNDLNVNYETNEDSNKIIIK